MRRILIESIFQCYRATGTDGNDKLLKIVPDWTEEAANDDHLWSVTSHNVDFCYIGESECSVSCNVNIYFLNPKPCLCLRIISYIIGIHSSKYCKYLYWRIFNIYFLHMICTLYILYIS